MRQTDPARDVRTALAKVDHPSVTAVDLSNRPSQTVRSFRNCYQMDMIRHQTVCQNLNLVSVTPLCHQVERSTALAPGGL